MLDNPEYAGNLNAEAVYDLTLLATGDEEKAGKAAGDRAMARMRQGLKP
jgi:hypothetical protein